MIIYLLFTGLLAQVVTSQRLIVAHAPSYVSFQEQDQPLPVSDVSKVISHSLGLLAQVVTSQRLIVAHAPSYVSFQEQDQPLPVSDVSKVISHSLGLLAQLVTSQRLIVAHAPSYVSFQEQDEPLPVSDVSKVISHSLGVSSRSDFSWGGMKQTSLFKRPKANVLVTVITMENAPGLQLKGKAEFPVDLDTPSVDINSLMTSLQGSFLDKNPLLLDAGLDNNIFDIKSEFDVFRKLPNTIRKMSDRLLDIDAVPQQHATGSLNTSLNTDLSLMGELQMIQDVINTVQSDSSLLQKASPDLFSFTVTGLHDVSNKHGESSQQSKDAQSLVANFLQKMTEQFKTIYKDNVVVEIIMINPPRGLLRKTRSLKQAVIAAEGKNNTYNLALEYNENYPVTFNMCLWLMIFLAIAVLGICYGIWNMDPGRDSIIYRMTTTRLKKD